MLISKFGHGTLSKVEEFENKYGIKFDDSYRTFLAKYNGGETPDTNWVGKRKTDVKVFFGYNIDEKNWDLKYLLSDTFMQELIEQKKIPDS